MKWKILCVDFSLEQMYYVAKGISWAVRGKENAMLDEIMAMLKRLDERKLRLAYRFIKAMLDG